MSDASRPAGPNAPEPTPNTGPLAGVRVLEVGGIGPGPFAGMMLADLGAEVIRVDRAGAPEAFPEAHRILLRGRTRLGVNLKDPRGVELVAGLAERADVLLEGYRPGVMERLGLGPDALLARHPRLVYGRMTGWGQDGPLAARAGHDLTYVATAGALHPLVGADGTPVPPLNMLGDFGGGGMLLAVGVLAALVHARETGRGQVVDAAIVDGTALLTAMLHGMRAGGQWSAAPGGNLFDGGAPYYAVYPTADGRHVAVGALEPPFYAALLAGLGLTEELAGVDRENPDTWPDLRRRFARAFAAEPLAHWLATFEGTDACVSEVVDPAAVLDHPHLAARGTYVEADGLVQPAPAPRFAATPTTLPPPAAGADPQALLAGLGYDADAITDLLAAGVVAGPEAG